MLSFFFAKACSYNSHERCSQFKHEYDELRNGYIGSMFTDEYLFDVQLVDSIVHQLKFGKALRLDKLIAEHLIHSHPALISILVKLFNIMISCGSVPASFGQFWPVFIQYLFLRSPSLVYC